MAVYIIRTHTYPDGANVRFSAMAIGPGRPQGPHAVAVTCSSWQRSARTARRIVNGIRDASEDVVSW